jgi:hypothetical protein
VLSDSTAYPVTFFDDTAQQAAWAAKELATREKASEVALQVKLEALQAAAIQDAVFEACQ